MKRGKIIYLNGVTSTGKTSIARVIQDTADEFFYLIGSDILMYMVGEKHRFTNYKKYEYEMFIDMYHIAKLLSDIGKIWDYPPTGKKIRYNAQYTARFENGLIVEIWATMDGHTVLKQIGIMG